MITLSLKTDGKKVFRHVDTRGCTLNEASIALFIMEQIKQELLNLEFPAAFDIEDKDV